MYGGEVFCAACAVTRCLLGSKFQTTAVLMLLLTDARNAEESQSFLIVERPAKYHRRALISVPVVFSPQDDVSAKVSDIPVD